MRTINKDHFQLWGNFIEWHRKSDLTLRGTMRVAPKVGDILIDGKDEYKFVEVSSGEGWLFATVEATGVK